MNWTNAEIREYFDSCQVTMQELSNITNKDIAELKRILMAPTVH